MLIVCCGTSSQIVFVAIYLIRDYCWSQGPFKHKCKATMDSNVAFALSTLVREDTNQNDSAIQELGLGTNFYYNLPEEKEDVKMWQWITSIREDILAERESYVVDTSKTMKTLPMLIEEIKKRHCPQVIVEVIDI